INDKPPWILLDEQVVVFEKIMALVRRGLARKKQEVVLVRGGPGTGKSVIAINLLAELMRKKIHAHYATGSRAFTETLCSIVGSRSRGPSQDFNSWARAERGSVDVLICDEAHRSRETSNSRFTKKERRSNTPQVHELLNAAQVLVFLLDDRQTVRPNEIGSTQ